MHMLSWEGTYLYTALLLCKPTQMLFFLVVVYFDETCGDHMGLPASESGRTLEANFPLFWQ